MKKTRFIALFAGVCASLCLGVLGACFEKSKAYENSFSDVAPGAWYEKDVASVYELGLMEGVSADTFDTESEMNVAQAITIAARLHSIYAGTEIPAVEGGRWFQKYVDYCINNGIMKEGQFDSYSRAVFSYEMVQLFAKALPAEFYPAINNIESIHDVPEGLIFRDDVLLFYNAGILNGNDDMGTFLPVSAITRKRAAVIISRVALPENRLTYSIDKTVGDTIELDEFSRLLSLHTTDDALDEVVLAAFGKHEITAALYRYFSYIHSGDKALIESEMKQFAAILKLADEYELKITRSIYEQCLASYYVNRVSTYGDGITYADALEAQSFTDNCFVTLSNASYYTNLLTQAFVDVITADEVYEYVLANDYVYATHILISKETEDAYRLALELRLAINDGADFNELLEKHGEDPGIRAREGGYFFTYGTMVEPFEKAAFALEEGQVSNIVESDFGYHIIKRLPFTKEELSQSPDYPTLASQAGSKNFYAALEKEASLVELVYTENFDALVEILK